MDGLRAHVARRDEAPEESWPGIVTWRTLIDASRGPSESVVAGIAELAPGASTKGARHRHAQHELYLVLRGAGLLHVDDEELALEPGSAAFIPGGAWHLAENTGDEPLELAWVLLADRFDDVAYEFDDA